MSDLSMETHLVRRTFALFICCLALVFNLAAATAAVPKDVLNSDVTQSTLSQTICKSGYTRTVRPSSTFTGAIKRRLLRERQLNEEDGSDYELDHVIPLALGGNPRSLKNLGLQPWNGSDGAKRKDRLEVKLQCLVCAGDVPLEEAREAIWTDWRSAYLKYGRLVCHRNRALPSAAYGD